jgi:hypothetical protein
MIRMCSFVMFRNVMFRKMENYLHIHGIHRVYTHNILVPVKSKMLWVYTRCEPYRGCNYCWGGREARN